MVSMLNYAASSVLWEQNPGTMYKHTEPKYILTTETGQFIKHEKGIRILCTTDHDFQINPVQKTSFQAK